MFFQVDFISRELSTLCKFRAGSAVRGSHDRRTRSNVNFAQCKKAVVWRLTAKIALLRAVGLEKIYSENGLRLIRAGGEALLRRSGKRGNRGTPPDFFFPFSDGRYFRNGNFLHPYSTPSGSVIRRAKSGLQYLAVVPYHLPPPFPYLFPKGQHNLLAQITLSRLPL